VPVGRVVLVEQLERVHEQRLANLAVDTLKSLSRRPLFVWRITNEIYRVVPE
jgi:hypothetical protein